MAQHMHWWLTPEKTQHNEKETNKSILPLTEVTFKKLTLFTSSILFLLCVVKMLLLHWPKRLILMISTSDCKKRLNAPEIEGLSINVGLCEKGSDIVKAALHHSQMQSWGENKDKQSLFTWTMLRWGGGIKMNNQLRNRAAQSYCDNSLL